MLLLMAIMSFSASFAQESSHIADTSQQSDLLVGEYSRHMLQTGTFGKQFLEEYRAYAPCGETMRSMENSIYRCSIVIVLGTWCDDSQEQVPRFYKMLDQLDYETAYVKNICLDREKHVVEPDITHMNIERVPTFIFYDGDREIGRIVETPEYSLEKDTYLLLTK